MHLAEPQPTASQGLRPLVERLDAAAGFAEVVASLLDGHGATLDGVWGGCRALVAATLLRHAPGPLLIVTPHPGDIDSFCEDLELFSDVATTRFPAWEAREVEKPDFLEVFGERLRLLKRFRAGSGPELIVTAPHALLQPVPSVEQIDRQTRRLAVGDTIDIEELLAWLVSRGLHATGAVELPGEFAQRGGILDVFAPEWLDPVRIEFFGDTIESLRAFEPSGQRSLNALPSVEITALAPSEDDRDRLTSYLPPNTWFLLVELSQIEEEARFYASRVERPADLHEVSLTLSDLYRFPSITASGISPTSLETTCRLRCETVERFSGDFSKVRAELDSAGIGQEVFIVCRTDAEIQRLGEIFAETRLAQGGHLHYRVGGLSDGFRLIDERIVIMSGAELFHRRDLSRPSRRRFARTIDSFLDLREGDYVVHLSHGIGRYRGFRILDKDHGAEEHLELEFDEGARIYVPASKIELVQKYVAGSKSRPRLAKIGGKSWVRQKEAAEGAVMDLAEDMLRLQAARASSPGITYPEDSEWQREFEASFPFQETPDQARGIEAIRQDMRRSRPMDRLICGDVGYGKTELAMRAAFKAVDSGYQVAVLVPTTVLAAQHGRSFRERMSGFPFRIETHSRFSTAAERKKTLAGLADGSVDVVIGTHGLAHPDVKFANLGLLVIDEEQRFGVDVKERLKTLRATVDVLTMTATPIPRTLHMSLLGLRDISNLETPPADRLAVETRVTRWDDELIRHAALRELNRGGQMYFVHNRVHDIEKMADRLRAILPEARIRVGHGQMPEGELESVMLDFVEHRFDLLLSTTIIESGLDIPNANTMFIDEADIYGLADLHQLRGRIGRYKYRAYCYMLLKPDKPLVPLAQRRLAAIQEFSEMGAGFAIAMRDLEIRGAGNILGSEQSGHIAAVGYELYCELLDRTVRSLSKLPAKVTVSVNVDLPGEALLPRSYVSDMRLKMDLYRRLSRVISPQELEEFRSELVDRFGPPPPQVQRLLTRMELRLIAHFWQIQSIHLEDRYAVLTYGSRPRMEQLATRVGKRLRIADGKSAYVPLAQGLTDGDAISEMLKSLLQPT